MFLGLLRILAPAARRAAHVVLFGEAAGAHRTQVEQFLFDPFDLLVKRGDIHNAGTLAGVPVSRKHKMHLS
jgi:hypothetical protein